MYYSKILEYLWLDGSGNRRSKTKIVNFNVKSIDDIPIWNYDGSSTGQADSNGNTEVILVPCKYFLNPLINNKNYDTSYDNYIVLCETFDSNMIALPSNHRHNAVKIFNKGLHQEPWFGIEQEYIMIHAKDEYKEEGRHYCGTQLNSIERQIAEEHMYACLKAKIKFCGLNSEVTDGQWEFQVGTCEGIEAGDHLTVANFLLERIAEKYNVKINYCPKLFPDKNGTGGHTNFSTSRTRSDNDGIEEIYRFMDKLKDKHDEHIAVYGEGNERRLTGIHETSSYIKFSFGVGTRNTSVRIPSQVQKEGCGYFEDRRPAANCDPYQVTAIIFQTCCL
jgi:glutamine synthetase